MVKVQLDGQLETVVNNITIMLVYEPAGLIVYPLQKQCWMYALFL